MFPVILLFKIPLLLSAARFSALCGTPPQSTPKADEEAKFQCLESKALRAVIRWLPPLLVMPSVWLTFICESTLILLTIFLPNDRPSVHTLMGTVALPNLRLTTSFILGWALLAAGALIRSTCYRHLGTYFTFELAVRQNHKLVTTGPYSIVRHPAYTGSIMALAGIALMQLGPGSMWAEGFKLWTTPGGTLLSFFWLGILMIIPFGIVSRTKIEDHVLRNEFGRQWSDWAARTRYRLLPGIF
ncbi:uncharacterized protein LAESUDRAFT_11212 [Laetiporus sulphureus 93-53]|uniref:Protein-S-isoprenylcysteine O-methyltransferase n=1 Tax=Laetiporus sulphureus 93-53 TaxID=1314785 RepID=A0A165I706_9APHY|nr:uncharacterized protein LAESUDRAFT_11212 [Laetiporus sulphureus 93-53]KZT12676.1 hypothetical protein LAESUDRAFT_11212 [Laetiporus sulphureus 93-53]